MTAAPSFPLALPSNAIAVAMLFLTGYTYGRCVACRPWLMGLSMVALGVASKQRSSIFPNVPTLAEAGLKGVGLISLGVEVDDFDDHVGEGGTP